MRQVLDMNNNNSGSIWDGEREFAADEDIAATVKGAALDAEARNERIAEFAESVLVLDMPGPLGSLLRTISHAYGSFCESEKAGGTTVGEETRLFGLLDEAMDTLDWLKEGSS